MSATFTAWDLDRMSQSEQDAYFGRTYVARLHGGQSDGYLTVWDDTPTTPTEIEAKTEVRLGVALTHLDTSLQALGWKRLEDWTAEIDADEGLHLAAAVARLDDDSALQVPGSGLDQRRRGLVHGPRL